MEMWFGEPHYIRISEDADYQEFKQGYRQRVALQQMELSFQEQIKQALGTRSNFAYHTNFHSPVDLLSVESFRQAGYQTTRLYMGLSKPALAQQRVSLRSKSQTTHVQEPTVEQIKERYQKGLTAVREHYKNFDRVSLMDNSYLGERAIPSLQIQLEQGQLVFQAKNLPDWIKQALPTELLKPAPTQKPKIKKGPRLG